MKTRYPNVTVDPDRHGKLRARFRKSGFKPAYMKTLPDQPGFEEELKALLAAPVEGPHSYAPRTVHDLVVRFYQSGEFAGRGSDTHRAVRRSMIEGFRAQFGDDLVADFEFQHIEAILLDRLEKRKNDKGRVVGGEVAARLLRKELRRLFGYAKKLKWIADNPVDDAERIGKAKVAGFYSWTEADISQFQRSHPLGTKPRLALEIILWTGQRRGDASTFGPQHIIRGKINFQAAKNGADLWLPIAPDLRRAIDAMPSVGLKTFLVTEYGQPFSRAGFGNAMRKWCDRAGLPGCSAHGLRKAIARRMASSEVTQRGMKAVGGWKGDAEVALYTAAAEQETLAEDAMNRIVERFSDAEKG